MVGLVVSGIFYGLRLRARPAPRHANEQGPQGGLAYAASGPSGQAGVVAWAFDRNVGAQGYLVIAVVLLLVKAVQLGGG